jgi:hypothetical protein
MTIYVELLNEGVQVWRPVDAEQISADVFKIVAQKDVDEDWDFETGDLVTCEERTLSNGKALVAIKKTQ